MYKTRMKDILKLVISYEIKKTISLFQMMTK
jgi:hypothetical protein